MCSPDVLMQFSCYLDNFSLIGDVIAKGMSLGVIWGTIVGVLILCVKKN